MKVMTFNLRHIIKEDIFWFWRRRYKRIAEFIENEDPDILGVQELTSKGKRYLKSRLKNYVIMGKKRHSIILTNEYNCILVKKDYYIKNHKTFSLSDKINELGRKAKKDNFPRICTIAHIKKDDVKYLIVNTHIDNSDKENKKRLLSILKTIIEKNKKEDEYVIITGDFNMTMNNKVLVDFSNNYISPFKDYLTGTFVEKKDMRAIDHIFLDKQLSYKNDKMYTSSNDNGFMSDHIPISCEVFKK